LTRQTLRLQGCGISGRGQANHLSPKEKAKEIVSLVEGVQQQQKTITGKVTDHKW
jgi:hypothetical protein